MTLAATAPAPVGNFALEKLSPPTVLLFTTDLTNRAYTDTKATLEGQGFTVVGCRDTATEINNALAANAIDVIAGVRYTAANAGPTLKQCWSEGYPLILGVEAARVDNELGHIATDLGAVSAIRTVASIVLCRHLGAVAEHPITSGFTPGSTVPVYPSDNWAVKATAVDYGTTLGTFGDSTDQYMTALDAGQPINGAASLAPGATAPARLVFCGFFYAGQSSNTAEGKTLIAQAIEWLATPPSAPSTPAAEATMAATAPPATASFDVAWDPTEEVTLAGSAPPATGSFTLEAVASAPQRMFVTEDTSTSTSAPATNYGTSTSVFAGTPGGGSETSPRFRFYFKVPPEAYNLPAVRLVLTRRFDDAPDTLALYRVKNDWSEATLTYNTRPAGDEFIGTIQDPGGPVGSTLEIELPAVGAYGFWLGRGSQANYASSEEPDESLRPYVIEPTAEPTPAAVDLTLTGTAPVATAAFSVAWDPAEEVTLAGSAATATGSFTLEAAAPAPNYVDEVLADAPLVYYRLGEASGSTLTDSSGWARHGTYSNSPTLGVPGAVAGDTAASFNGTNQSAHVPYATWMDVASITLEAWVKTTDTEGVILARDEGGGGPYNLRLHATYGLYAQFSNAGWSSVYAYGGSPAAIADGAWHHVAATYGTDGVIRVYVDGLDVTTSGTAGAALGLATWPDIGLVIARQGGAGSLYLAGDVDDVAIYDRVLSPERIAAHHSAAATAPPPTVPTAELTLVAAAPAATASFDLEWDPAEEVTIAGAAPPATATFSMDAPTAPPPAGEVTLAGVGPAVTAAFSMDVPTAPTPAVEVTLDGDAPPATAAFNLSNHQLTTVTLAGSGPAPTASFTAEFDPTEELRLAGVAPRVTAAMSLEWVPVPLMRLEVLDPTLIVAPTAVTVALFDAQPATDVVFDIDGVVVATITADSSGAIGPVSLPVSEDVGAAGVHTITATQPGSQTATDTFTLNRGPTKSPRVVGPDADPVDVPGAETSTGVRRWVLQDLMPGGLGSYVFPHNPTTMDEPHFEKPLEAMHTTSVGGVFHVFEGVGEPVPWQINGYCPDQAMHDKLLAYAALNRRFYLIDHRGRAWKVTFQNVDLVARKRQRTDSGAWNDWAHDYTITALVYDQDWLVPA